MTITCIMVISYNTYKVITDNIPMYFIYFIFSLCEIVFKFKVCTLEFAQFGSAQGWIKIEKVIGCNNFSGLLIYIKNLLPYV